MRPLYPPLLHTICLVYSNSKYYNTSARIIVLLTVRNILENYHFEGKYFEGNMQHAHRNGEGISGPNFYFPD